MAKYVQVEDQYNRLHVTQYEHILYQISEIMCLNNEPAQNLPNNIRILVDQLQEKQNTAKKFRQIIVDLQSKCIANGLITHLQTRNINKQLQQYLEKQGQLLVIDGSQHKTEYQNRVSKSKAEIQNIKLSKINQEQQNQLIDLQLQNQKLKQSLLDSQQQLLESQSEDRQNKLSQIKNSTKMSDLYQSQPDNNAFSVNRSLSCSKCNDAHQQIRTLQLSQQQIINKNLMQQRSQSQNNREICVVLDSRGEHNEYVDKQTTEQYKKQFCLQNDIITQKDRVIETNQQKLLRYKYQLNTIYQKIFFLFSHKKDLIQECVNFSSCMSYLNNLTLLKKCYPEDFKLDNKVQQDQINQFTSKTGTNVQKNKISTITQQNLDKSTLQIEQLNKATNIQQNTKNELGQSNNLQYLKETYVPTLQFHYDQSQITDSQLDYSKINEDNERREKEITQFIENMHKSRYQKQIQQLQ